jgi:hypothetical protein
MVPPIEFDPRPSMSFFLYNQDGHQAVARPFLDGVPANGPLGPSALDSHTDMPKYHQADAWDGGTNAPSQNFIYDFDVYQYFVNHRWEEVLSHDEQGRVRAGSVSALGEAFRAGCEIKVGISGLCADFCGEVASGSLAANCDLPHEVFVQSCTSYLYPDRGYFSAETQPVVRVTPAIPLAFRSGNWDFGWVICRTDGALVMRRCDPYTLQFADREGHAAMRWFVG